MPSAATADSGSLSDQLGVAEAVNASAWEIGLCGGRWSGNGWLHARLSCGHAPWRSADGRFFGAVVMPADRMHADEAITDMPLVRRLLAAQIPRWAELPLTPVFSAGTDNTLYRLGDEMVVRLPRIERAAGQVDKEHRWLPQLAPLLPLAIPVPLIKGSPGEGYPWRWSVYQWLDGQTPTHAGISESGEAATQLGRFVGSLQRIDPSGGPPAGAHNFYRGVPLALRDSPTRAAIAALHDVLDETAAIAAWEAALRAPAWCGTPVWIHGDLQPENLLVREGRISAVIDFGGLAVGDPAVDLMIAWNLLTSRTRIVFCEALGVDDETWARGRGWALSTGLIALAYYQHSNRSLAAISRHAIDEVLADHQRGR